MDFKVLKTEKLSEKVTNEIIHMIEMGKLKPGDKLPMETDFAKMLGTSRGTLREALTILEFRGLIRRKPKDGTYIRELENYNYINESILGTIKKASYKDLIEMREPIEQKIVELAILRAKDDEIRNIINYLEEAKNVDEYDNKLLDYNFHFQVAELSKNILLVNTINLYYDLIHEIGESSLKKENRKQEVLEEHKNIIIAIMNRDVEGARNAVAHHLRMVGKSIDGIEMNKLIETKWGGNSLERRN